MVTMINITNSESPTTTQQEEEALPILKNIPPVAIPVQMVKLPRKGLEMVVGVIKAEDLVPRGKIDKRIHVTDQGYQRELNTSRVRSLAKSITEKRVDLPTGILLNLREFQEEVHLERKAGDQAILKLNGNTDGVSSPEDLFEIDGMHRCESLKLCLEGDYERFRHFPIVFCLGLGWSLEDEIEQFYTVNSTAKSPPTNLAYDLLTSMARANADLMSSLEDAGQSWKVHGQQLAEVLNKESGVWQGRIRFSNQEKGVTTLPSAGFVRSIQQVLNGEFYSQLSQENQAQILMSYWEGLKKVLPDTFSNPEDSVMQKALGANVMHSILPTVIEIVRSRKESLLKPDPYANVLKNPLLSLSSENSNGDVVEGEKFWLSGPEGAAGSYSSSAGRRILTSRLRRELPPIESLL